jgi:Lrp/AsnC family transcriptional regulator of ectoine degradation
MIVTVELKNNETKKRSEVEEFVKNCDVILECYGTSGDYDYILKAVSNNITDYGSLIDRISDEDIGISKYRTYVITKIVKQYRGMPIRHLLGSQL